MMIHSKHVGKYEKPLFKSRYNHIPNHIHENPLETKDTNTIYIPFWVNSNMNMQSISKTS